LLCSRRGPRPLAPGTGTRRREGTAGIGKTRLLAEARRRAAGAAGSPRARREFEGNFAFGVVRQLFEPLLATASPEVRAELLAGAATLAEPLFDASSLAAPTDTEGDTSFATLHGLYWLAANVAFERPTMLAIGRPPLGRQRVAPLALLPRAAARRVASSSRSAPGRRSRHGTLRSSPSC
jgi:hypothetical protein